MKLTHGVVTALLVLVLGLGMVVQAQSIWDAGGADSNWSTPENWADDTVPASGADVTFGTAGSAAVVDTTSRTVGDVTFNRAGAFGISASGGATLEIEGDVTIGSGQTYTLNVPLVGASRVAFIHTPNAVSTVVLGGDNSGFSGGFDAQFMASTSTGDNRYLTLRADAADSLGPGVSRVFDNSALRFTTGALSGSESRIEVTTIP